MRGPLLRFKGAKEAKGEGCSPELRRLPAPQPASHPSPVALSCADKTQSGQVKRCHVARLTVVWSVPHNVCHHCLVLICHIIKLCSNGDT